jgi:hypothetical protein
MSGLINNSEFSEVVSKLPGKKLLQTKLDEFAQLIEQPENE